MGDFKKWLKENDMDDWITWMQNNPDLADKEYPSLIKGLKKRIKKNPSYKAANYIQEYPKFFNQHKIEVEELIGPTKRKRILQQIEAIYSILHYDDSNNEIVLGAVNSVKDDLFYQLEQWKIEFERSIYLDRPKMEQLLNDNKDYIKTGKEDGTIGKKLLEIGKPHGYKSERSLRNKWNKIYDPEDDLKNLNP